VKAENHRFWGEVGYDFTWDNEHNALDRRTQTHAGRAFLGYQNKLNEHVEWLANVESLFNFEEGEDIRVNADTTLRVAVATRLQLELQFKMQFDNVPVPNNESLDTQTTIRLVYNLF
jgi:putative salt-induced outer membrane protein YdiY